MNVVWAAGGAAVGMPVGSMLRMPVFRLSVPAGDLDRSACPHCGAPLRPSLAVTCQHCGVSPGTPVVLELVTAAVLALLLGRFGGQADVAAFCYLGTIGVALAAIDLKVQRLPDRLTLPAYPVLITLLAVAAATRHDASPLVRALLGGASLAVCYLLLALLRPGQLGGGDIKLAGLTGLAMGWLGWTTLLSGAALGFLLSALVSLALLAMRRITLHSVISFGPFLLGGALLAIVLSGP